MDKLIRDKVEELRSEIGNTTLIDLGDGVFGKLEGENPTGSVKDRAAFYIILRALEIGALKEGGIICEATSGNMGIGLAFVAQKLGLRAIMTMPESMTVERRKMIADYGAEVVLTPASGGMSAAVLEAMKICTEKGAFFANQFANYASVEAHFETTAPEVFFDHPQTKHIVCGVGSGGTAMGVAKYIKVNNLDCNVVAVEPASSPLLSDGIAGGHKIQGIGANFVPEIVDKRLFDKIMTVSNDDAFATIKEIFDKTGEKCGISSGAAYSVAKALRKEVVGDIVVILPDNGKRYSDNLYI